MTPDTKQMTKIEADLYGIRLLEVAKQLDYEKLEIAWQTFNYEMQDRWIKRNVR